MSAGRVLGGIIALFGGLFVLLICFIRIQLFLAMGDVALIDWVINLLIGFLALIGGILGLASKSGGGVAIVAGLASLILGILSATVLDFSTIFSQQSFFNFYWNIGPWIGITLEAILMIIGAVIMLASGPGK